MSGSGVIGVLLAGGRSRRMGGGDKCLRPLAGRPLLAWVADRLREDTEPVGAMLAFVRRFDAILRCATRGRVPLCGA